jgi:hypothetical protein
VLCRNVFGVPRIPLPWWCGAGVCCGVTNPVVSQRFSIVGGRIVLRRNAFRCGGGGVIDAVPWWCRVSVGSGVIESCCGATLFGSGGVNCVVPQRFSCDVVVWCRGVVWWPVASVVVAQRFSSLLAEFRCAATVFV